MSSDLVSFGHLPALPITMHPITGAHLVEQRLMPYFPFASPADGMARWRAEHTAERAPFRAVFWMERKRNGKAVVRFVPREGAAKHRIVGMTPNDPDAARILIGNARAGCYLTRIRWELYGDRECEELLDMGRFDQWDLLKGIPAEKLGEFSERSMVPTGDWDFDKILWGRTCAICGTNVVVNGYLYNVDSVVCAECGNRPFLAPAMHRHLDAVYALADPECAARMHVNITEWLASVRANFYEVRLDTADTGGRRLEGAWRQSLMARAIDPATARETRALIERHTSVNFDMYRVSCEMVHRALTDAEPFREEHAIAAEFAARASELVRVRLLASGPTES